MPVQPAQSLKQNINRREIGQQQIRVDVKALFERLSADKNKAPANFGFSAEALLDGVIEEPAVFRGEAPMMRCYYAACAE
jgi:hypothetical protein